MNKNVNTGFRIFYVALIVFAIAAGCRSGGSEQKKETAADTPENLEKVQQDIKQAEKIFNALPSPLESAMLIKAADAPFERKFLNPVENAKQYTSTRSLALNLGIYTCDLSFASLYDQTQLIIDYMNAAKKMADGLGILDAISKETVEKLEENINNRDVIMEIISETFLTSNSTLEDNDQSDIASIVLTGGWLEGLYISTQLVDAGNFAGNKLVTTIVDQKNSIGILINLLEGNKGNPAVDELLVQINSLKAVYDKINVQSTPVKAELDKATNVTVLKSNVTSDISVNLFTELKNTVASIRTTFVK